MKKGNNNEETKDVYIIGASNGIIRLGFESPSYIQRLDLPIL